ncbi:hypothetical protein UY3_13784 [Chelonia mydas]|uniref:Uncharacterized protein n=1 Tax=Chelonia mydas TaxID=8469 RepID=M7B111_CHEMY|nr:hypothetical protein UY3_13784 [Chelonia mydas]
MQRDGEEGTSAATGCGEECQELGVLVPQVKNTEHTIITPRARTMLKRTPKDSIHWQYLKTDQGKAFEVKCKWDASNHFLPGGSFTQFANWKFIHRARLNCVPLNRAVRHRNWDKQCRKLGYANETLRMQSHSLKYFNKRSFSYLQRKEAGLELKASAGSPTVSEFIV